MLRTTWDSEQVLQISAMILAAQRDAGGCEQEICKSLGALRDMHGSSGHILLHQEKMLKQLGDRLSEKAMALQRLENRLRKADSLMCETERRLCRSCEEGGRNTLKTVSGIAGIIRLVNTAQTGTAQTAETYRRTFGLSDTPFPACPTVRVASPVSILRMLGKAPLVTPSWLSPILGPPGR